MSRMKVKNTVTGEVKMMSVDQIIKRVKQFSPHKTKEYNHINFVDDMHYAKIEFANTEKEFHMMCVHEVDQDWAECKGFIRRNGIEAHSLLMVDVVDRLKESELDEPTAMLISMMLRTLSCKMSLEIVDEMREEKENGIN